MNRRTFTSFSALALAGSRLPLQAQAGDPVRFAAVGLGTISDIFMQACALSTKCKITGLVSGHADQKSPGYEQKYGILPKSVYTYETFDRIADDRNIDAVYIGLPNSMHAEYTIRAAKAGKHVLCEKPMAISSAECRAMIEACKQANVKLMIAYRIHYDPMWQGIRDLARSGALGELQGFQGGFYGPKQEGEWRLNRTLAGGGSLFDLGIYPLNAIRWICGEEPTSFSAQVATKIPGPRFAQVEESIEFSMKFPSNLLASSGSSYGESGGNYLMINGDKGHLEVTEAFSYQGLRYTGRTVHGPVSGVSTVKSPYQFTFEADHFADCVRHGTQPATAGEEGLADMLAIESIYRAAGAPLIHASIPPTTARGDAMNKAQGTFTIAMLPVTPTPAPGVARFSIDKQLQGDLQATSKGEMLSAGDPKQGAAGYVAMEIVTGTLAGKQGSFALQHSGTMDASGPKLTVTVVPGSGTAELKGISGALTIKNEGGQHSYELEYTLPG